MYLLDTNVLSALRRPDKAPATLLAWASALPPETTCLSVVTLMELEHGILSLARRDAAQAALLRQWLEGSILPAFQGRVLDVDEQVARAAARLMVSAPMPINDVLIAATARVHGLVVATRNVRDFERLDVALLDPWAL